MRIIMRYGKEGFPLDLPDELDVTLIRKKAMPVLEDPREAVKKAFSNPVACKTLREEAKGCRSACILICDITRPVPNGLVLPPLVRELIEAGISPGSITVLVATGLHRPNEGEELREIVGDDWVLNTVNVANHFARNEQDHVFLANTSEGIEVGIDRRFVEAELRVAVGLVEPHFMAGYSGGKENRRPRRGPREDHPDIPFPPGCWSTAGAVNCVIEGNPLHEAQLEIVGMIGKMPWPSTP